MGIALSKSSYTTGRACPLSLWFNWHSRGKKTPAPNSKQKAKSSNGNGRQQGNEIGKMAQQALSEEYGGGVEVSAPFYKTQDCIDETEALIAAGEELIFEATARNPNDETFAHIDALRKVPGTKDEWDLIEVKSGTSAKSKYKEDMAFQYHVFTNAGYKIRNSYIMFVNNKYERDGDIELDKFFKKQNVIKTVNKLIGDVPVHIKELQKLLKNPNPPSFEVSLQCNDPYGCRHKKDGHGWPLHSIFQIYAGKAAKDMAAKIGSVEIDDIPEDKLPEGAKAIDVKCHKSGQEHIDHEKLKEFLDDIKYPIYYLDYETIMAAIPYFDGTRPYQQIPTQFSLHVQNKEGGNLTHNEFIHQDRSDPRRAFAEALVAACGDKGSVIVYNQNFEESRNNELAAAFPDLADKINNISARMVDLYKPFQQRWLYSPEQHGSASIKAVLPSFTSLSYDGMDIPNGLEAMNEMGAYMKNDPDAKPAKELFPALLKYCELDTFAMVELLDVVKEKANTPPAAPSSKPKPDSPAP